ERGGHGRPAGGEVGGVLRVQRLQVGLDVVAGPGHVRRVVPQVRVVARALAERGADVIDPASGGGGGGEQLGHPLVVAGPVQHDVARAGDPAGGQGRRAVVVRVALRVADDAVHPHVAAAELADQAAPE